MGKITKDNFEKFFNDYKNAKSATGSSWDNVGSPYAVQSENAPEMKAFLDALWVKQKEKFPDHESHQDPPFFIRGW